MAPLWLLPHPHLALAHLALARLFRLPHSQLGQLMDGMSVSLVVASKSPRFKPGQKIFLMSGWQEWTVFDAESEQGKAVEILPEAVDFEDSHYVCGVTSLTAYFGLLRVCEMKPGDTVVVSGAGGATGSMVGQLAKALGAGKVIGVAGGPEKCAHLQKTLGYDVVLDYKVDRKTFTKNVSDALRGTKGIDCYFDKYVQETFLSSASGFMLTLAHSSTGGMITEVLFNRLALKARVAICGSISSYEGTSDPRISIALGNLVPSRGRVEGFLVSDYSKEYDAARKHIVELVQQGKIKSLHTTLKGIENAPLALAMLFDGRNNGKMQCLVADPAQVTKEIQSAKL